MTRLHILSMVALLGLASSAHATVIGFDDIVAGNTVVALPAMYGGISFTDPNFGVYGYTDGAYTAHSASNRVLTDRLTLGQTAITFTFVTPVIFDGAWFSGSSAAGDVSFQLSSNNAVVANSTSVVLSSTPTFIASSYQGTIDKVTIYGVGGFYVFDDVTFHAPITTSAVPEPSTGALLLIPACAWALLKRRKRNETL